MGCCEFSYPDWYTSFPTPRPKADSLVECASEALEANDEEFEVPEGCIKPDTNIDSYQALRHLLASLSFWGVSEVPGEVLDFLLQHGEIG